MNINKDELYFLYDFMFNTREEFDVFIKKHELKEDEEVINLLNKKLSDAIIKKQTSRKILNSLAKKYLVECNSVEDALANLSEFEETLKQYDIKLNKYLCESLINSSLLVKNNIILIFDNNKDAFLKNEYETNSILVYYLLDSWCDLNKYKYLVDDKEISDLDISKLDSIKMLLQSTPQHKLTLEEQEQVGKDLLSDDEEKRKQAKQKLALSNIRLVISIAKKYQGRGLDYEDLVSSGIMGLLQACDRFDVTQGFNFSTYATWWVKQGISREIMNNSKTIRIPVHIHEYINKLDTIIKHFEKTKGFTPTTADLAEEIGVNELTIKKLDYYNNGTVSLNQTISTEETDSSELGDFIVDDEAIPVEESGIKDIFRDDMLKLIDDSLKEERDREVIKMRMGFYGKIYSLREVGEKFGITRERVRQIELDSIIKLRKNKKTKSYADLADNPKKALQVLEDAKKASYLRKYRALIIDDEDEKIEQPKKDTSLESYIIRSNELEIIDMYMYDNALINTDSSGLPLIYQIRTILQKEDVDELIDGFDKKELEIFKYCFCNPDGNIISPAKVGSLMNINSNVAFKIYRGVLDKLVTKLKEKGYRFNISDSKEKVKKFF